MSDPDRIHQPRDTIALAIGPADDAPDEAPDFERLLDEAQRLIDQARRLREESLARARAKRPIERLKS